ncbi:hypothetical protein AK830_g1626 [Neonectria ditissima]|uniref:Uncharacterized protein n=1 Tax=Neonectria ditissima TaxID=78410 RepID=A0A0P7BMH5_9HYPO|nr:hypothetical protein AK830_g1626 [Neonectria ditissima]
MALGYHGPATSNEYSGKLDISLIKFEVPAEYGGLSAALTSSRRDAAEQGTAHKTARRLGILFHDILPATPELLRAYGRRATDISGKSTNLSERSISKGIFANFLGADITSVWAAATSGASSIAVHLLSCLLARLWSGPEATSIWVEIVAERTRQILFEEKQGVYKTSLELQIVSRQEVSRNDLAEWDAGARAWLQIADDAQMRRQKQLMLIINNIHLPVNTGGSTFDRVMDAWTKALEAMEKLVGGQPQRIVKAATLMGIASWHIYPDLHVLGDVISTVKFGDDLVPDTGQLTIGLENVDSEKQDGIFWSLPLSHLQFYGDPVVAQSNTSRDASRFSMEELQMLAFGSATSTWEAITWTRASLLTFSWHKTLIEATGDELKNNLAIVALGRRNGRQFLSEKHHHPLPYLGLGHPFVSHLLKRPKSVFNTEPLERMRFVASQLGLRPNECIIRIRKSLGSSETRMWFDDGFYKKQDESNYEYLTAVPHTDCFFLEFTPPPSRSDFNLGIGITRPGKNQPGHEELFIRLVPSRGKLCGCYLSSSLNVSNPEFGLLAGDTNDVALFIRTDVGLRPRRQRLRNALSRLAGTGYVSGKSVIASLESGELVRSTLCSYLELFSREGFVVLPGFAKDLRPEIFRVGTFVLSLNALRIASDTYKSLGGATASLRVIERPLCPAQWVPKTREFWDKTSQKLERRQQFACIAFFESGSYDLNPFDLTEVIAMSTRNSI